MTRLHHAVTAGAALGAALLALTGPIAARAAGPDLAGKTITFITGTGPGGGYDTYMRMLAPHYEKALGATVIVRNEPGAGGMRALNRLYIAPPEPVEVMIVNGTGQGLQQLVGLSAVRFDLTKVKHLGVVNYARWVWLVSPNSSIKTVADAKNLGRKINWAGSGRIGGISDGAAFTCYILKLNCNVVIGYDGSRSAALAMAKGEMDAMYVSATSAYRYVKSKNARALVTMNRERSDSFPNLPTITEVMKLNDDQLWWLDYRNTVEGLGRMLVMPPSTPDDVAAKMRTVTHQILTDPKIVAEFAKRNRPINYRDAADAKKMVQKVLSDVTPEQKAEIRKVVLGPEGS